MSAPYAYPCATPLPASARSSEGISLKIPPFAFKQIEDSVCGIEHVAAGAEDGSHAVVEQKLAVLPRDHAAANDDNVFRSLGLQRLDQARHQCLVAGGERGDAQHMHL